MVSTSRRTISGRSVLAVASVAVTRLLLSRPRRPLPAPLACVTASRGRHSSPMGVGSSGADKPVVARFFSEDSDEAPADAKVLYFLRHAQGTHNVNKDYRSPANIDAKLTELGESQCHNLAGNITGLELDLIISSPLTRTLQTATLSFAEALAEGTPIIAEENLRETVNYNCDRRSRLSELREAWPGVNFSGVHDEEDPVWAKYVAIFGDEEAFIAHRESDDLDSLAARARALLTTIASRPEKRIALVSHNAFLTHLFNTDLGGIVEFADETAKTRLSKTWENCELRGALVVIRTASAL